MSTKQSGSNKDKTTMTVYIVEVSIPYEGSEVLEVFATREAAERYCAKEVLANLGGEPYITEYVVKED